MWINKKYMKEGSLYEKKLLSLIVSTIIGVMSFSSVTFANASTVNKEGTKIGDVMTEKQAEISNNFLRQHHDLAKTFKNSRGPAPKLTQYYTYFVANNFDKSNDTITGYEYVNGKLSTTNDFNGTVYVGTVEVGYGQESAKFAGSNLSSYDTVFLDFNEDRIIDGFIDIWQLTNVTSGKFESNCITTNGTGLPIYTSVNIK